MGYSAKRNDDNSNSEEESQKKSGFQKAKGAYDSYKASGSLGNLAKDKAKEAIGNKINEKLADRLNSGDKKDGDDKNKNPKEPESLQKQKDLAQNKLDNAKKNEQDKKKEGREGKNGEAKKELNEKAFRTAVRTAADVAGGAGEIADKMLDTPIGQPAVEEARNASNPVSAVAEGTKKLAETVKSLQKKKKIIVAIAPYLGVFILVIIILASVHKFGDSQAYYKTDPDTGEMGISAIENNFSDEYASFYKNVDKYSSKYGADDAMIVAVLTSYQDNEVYVNIDDPSDIDDTDSDLTDEDGTGAKIEKESKKYMKKQIIKVAKAIKSSGSITKGEYDDRNTGSKFFWWLYDEYIEEYYDDYFGDGMSAKDKDSTKQDIIDFIYMYYEDLRSENPAPMSYTSSICPNGVTIKSGKYAGNYSLEDYIKGVVAGEAGAWSKYPEALKAHAVAARSFIGYYYERGLLNGNCEVENSASFIAYRDPTEFPASIKAVEDTAGLVVKKNGKIHACTWVTIPVRKYITESGANYIFDLLYDPNDPKSSHRYTMPKRVYTDRQYSEGGLVRPTESSDHHWGMIQYGAVYEENENNKNYEEILKIFYGDDIEIANTAMGVPGEGKVYGNKGVYSASLFPMGTDMSNIRVTQGYRYAGGDSHGAIDVCCNRDKAKTQTVAGWREWCNTLPIIAAHSGTIISYSNQYCTKYKSCKNGVCTYNRDSTLKFISSCTGLGIRVRVDDKNDPYYGYTYEYWHFERFADGIKRGATVQAGQLLGYMGSTGNSSTWHLHFAIIDPNGNNLNQNNTIRAFAAANHLAIDTLNGDGEGKEY